ncbi:hypothetical protein [Methylobacter sp.]|uniref:hypothetical protein n=1 Tax=Methylobacter sp. TaxID=2051955 RepID=UPI002489E29D|nr:hypothetical protein [Methylobacter sp.]MDI1279266.1 hypothetical protein [Methylobacter sp.]
MSNRVKKNELDLDFASLGGTTDIDLGIGTAPVVPAEQAPVIKVRESAQQTVIDETSNAEQAYLNATPQEQRYAQMQVENMLNVPISAIQLANELGYKGDLSPGALEDGIRSAMKRTIDESLDIGRRLLLLKSVSAHGEFTKRVELLGFSPRMARKFMSATQKFAKTDLKAVLKVGSQTKLLELLVLDDEEIEALANGETIGDLNLDEIECMSVSELKAALRDRDSRLEDMTNAESKQVKVLKSEIDHRDALIAKMKHRNPEYQFSPEVHFVREECLVFQAKCELALNSIWALFEATANEEETSPEHRMRLEQIWVTAHVAAACAVDMLNKVKAIAPVPDLPESIGSMHTMTDAEAQKWLLDYELVERKHHAEQAERDQKRRDSAPKGPGRPKK